MHGFHRGIERRLRALEARLGTIPATETADQTARRLVLCRYALRGETPADLTATEVPVFEKIVASVPIFSELVHEGLVDDHGEAAGAVDPLDETEDDLGDDEDGEHAWRA